MCVCVFVVGALFIHTADSILAGFERTLNAFERAPNICLRYVNRIDRRAEKMRRGRRSMTYDASTRWSNMSPRSGLGRSSLGRSSSARSSSAYSRAYSPRSARGVRHYDATREYSPSSSPERRIRRRSLDAYEYKRDLSSPYEERRMPTRAHTAKRRPRNDLYERERVQKRGVSRRAVHPNLARARSRSYSGPMYRVSKDYRSGWNTIRMLRR